MEHFSVLRVHRTGKFDEPAWPGDHRVHADQTTGRNWPKADDCKETKHYDTFDLGGVH
jgi:hypothetical protein